MRRFVSPIAVTVLAATLTGCWCQEHDHDRHDHHYIPVTRAITRLQAIGDSGVQGTLTFESVGKGVRVKGRITGLTPGEHGFHIHQWGDLSDIAKGESAGSHFDPHGKPHGHPDSAERHAGDLGNVLANAEGVADVDKVDPMLRLDGPDSIVGRSVVVHVGPDKFTQPVGDAGGRVAVGVIGVGGPAK